MFLRGLPVEILYDILGHCSPSDLASLSRVHTSVRDAAEQNLYSHIQYYVQPFDIIGIGPWVNHDLVPWELNENGSLLQTFATNARKALMVKAFYVELEDIEDDSDHSNAVYFVLVKLAEALEKMPNLVDLRIIYSPMIDLSEGRIGQAIRGGYFKLDTLYMEYTHDFEGIIANQPQLRILGIYFTPGISDVNFWTEVERLYQSPSRRRTMPVVFMLDCLEDHGLIRMLPSFHRPGEALRVWRETVASVNKWPNSFYEEVVQLSLSLLGISEENIGLLGEAMTAMAAYLRDYAPIVSQSSLKIFVHDGYIKKPWRYPEFVKPLELFEGVEVLHFFFPEVKEEVLRLLSTDLQLCMVKDLGRAWPTIQEIILLGLAEDDLVLDRESNWTITEGDVDEMQTESEDENHSDLYYDSYGEYDSQYDSDAWDGAF